MKFLGNTYTRIVAFVSLMALALATGAQTFPVQNLQVNGTSKLTGNVTASAAIAASGALSGASINVGTGALTAGYTSPYTGATTRDYNGKQLDIASLFDFAGVDPTGVADSTTGIQAALTATRLQSGNQRPLLWRTGTYKITTTLTIGTNQVVIFEPGVIINAVLNVNTPLFSASNQVGVYFYGNGAVINGNRAGVVLSNTGNQTCFYIYGSDNVVIQDFNIVGFGFDGITLTGDNSGSGPSTNVRLINDDVNTSGRNGLSIIYASGVVVQGGRYWASNGTPSGPWAGIDVEPNAGQNIRDVVLVGVRTQDNNGNGLEFVPSQLSSAPGGVYDVTVLGGHSTNDGLASTGSTGFAGVLFTNGGALTNEIAGQVSIRDFIVENPNAMGFRFYNWDGLLAPRVYLDNTQVYNPNFQAASTGNVNRSGYVLYTDSTQAVTSQGKVFMKNAKAIDNRASPTMVFGMYIAADSGLLVRDTTVQDFVAENYITAVKAPVFTDLSLAGGFSNVVVTYSNPSPVSAAASVISTGYGGQRVNLTTGGTSQTLATAAKAPGLYYETQCDPAAASNCSILRAGSDQIKSNGVASAVSYSLQPGDVARCRSLGATTWNCAPVN